MKKRIAACAMSLALALTTMNISAAPLLNIGSRGDEVSKVQQTLLEKGYFQHEVTGYYGHITKDAVRRFQRDAGIGIDGIVGPITRDALWQQAGNTTVNEDDVYWLSRIVHAEAQGEAYNGKLAVANTILNRVKSSQFPNTIYGVIFDTKHGVQYTPTVNGAIYNTPGADSVRAAREALSGKSVVGNALYFCNPKTSSNGWIMKNRPYHTTIGNHAFYL